MKFKNFLVLMFCIMALPVFASTEAKLYYNQGIDYYKTGQYDKAMQSFRMATDEDPNYIDAYYNLGSILQYLGQNEAALSVFSIVVSKNPKDYDAVLKCADLAKDIGDIDKAKEYLALIPSDSYLAHKAQKIANELKTDLQTIKYNKNHTEKLSHPSKNGVYENIPSPTGITFDSNNNLFVANYSDNTIYKITPKGEKVVFIKDRRINGPIGIFMDNTTKNLYVANYLSNNVLKIDATGKVSVLISDVIKPYGVCIKNSMLYVSSQGTNSIIRYKL